MGQFVDFGQCPIYKNNQSIVIYITRLQNTTVITDNIIDYIPDNLSIYLDDVLIGTYANLSTTLLYLKFTIPVADISAYQEREYNMKITNYSATIKEELIIVKDNTAMPIVEVTKTKSIKFYE